MAFTIHRLTIYALLSALERDLRDFLALHVSPLTGTSPLLAPALAAKAKERFLKEDPDAEPDSDELLEYLDLGEEIQVVRANERHLDDGTKNYIKRYYVALEGLIPVRNRVMHSRPLEFDDLPRVSDLANELIRSHRSLWANLRTARRELERDPDTFATLTIPDTPDETASILHNLPLSEFDDTGFVGRGNELNELRRALRGSFPVVTVVGEGGLGKTALALRACYDLLDDENAPFDAIVWTTAKTTKLTLTEIQTIDGAISSSLGIIESATSLLGKQTDTLAIDDLLLHLTNNRILLVIDNLETVIDQNIRTLVRQVPTGSRILFTTRIGLGAFDFPIPLSPFNKKEASFYFRRTAQVWGLSDLSTSSPAVVDGYCEKLQYNPLFIKWFVQSVRAGKRPTQITSNPKLFLEFCLQNVFNSLNSDAKRVASTLASLNGPQTVAGIAYFTDLDSLTIQSALSLLITSNLVSSERGRSSEDEDRYYLSHLARMYIQSFIRVGLEQQKILISKQNALRSAQEEFSARAGADIFDIKNVYVRDKDDYIVAQILTRAIEDVFRKNLARAETEIQRAKDLSPNYFEVHRVTAMLNIAQEDYFAAEAAYEAAISLASERAPLRLWFAGFLSRQLGDQDRAIEHLQKAESLAPESAFVKLEFARVLQYQRRFDDAENRLKSIQDIDKLSSRTRRMHLDLIIQNDLRKSEHLCSQLRYTEALECLAKAKSTLEATPQALIDSYTERHVSHARRHFPLLRDAFKGLADEAKLEEIIEWLLNPARWAREQSERSAPQVAGRPVASQPQDVPNRGRLRDLHKTFGFIESGGGARYFFHRTSWESKRDYLDLGEGFIVDFEIGETDKGPCALGVRPMGQERPANKVLANGSTVLGAIKSLEKTFGFITLDVGGDLFFHRSNCTPTTKFNRLAVGDRVRCVLEIRPNKKKAGTNVELYSGL